MFYLGLPQFEQFLSLPLYLSGIGHLQLQPPIYRPDGLGRHQFLYCEQGSGTININGMTLTFPAKHGIYIPANTPHEYYANEAIWDTRWIACNGSGVEELCSYLEIPASTIVPLNSISPLDIILSNMHHEAIIGQNYGYLSACSLINKFIIEFYRQGNLLTNANDSHLDIYQQHMLILEDYIQNNYMNNISIEELCTQISVTPQHLCRIFRQCTKKRPTEYINIVRIEYAKDYLITTNYSISNIASKCGFESTSYFGKLFKNSTGVTPKQYKLNHFTK